MSTGWNFNFNQKYAKRKKKEELRYIKLFNKKGLKTSREKNDLFREGLNCGPAGRNALIRWIEYNYELKNEEENGYPAVSACKVWQNTQSFQDITLSGLVDFLKFLNIPKHITYKNVFDNYLSLKFISKVKSIENSQKCLTKLAKKMILMFQVREIQPLFSMLLEKIDVIPLGILNILIEETPAAKYFYKITSIKVRRKIWVLCPDKFYEEVEHIIEEIILRMKLRSTYDETITNLINEIIELIGEENEKTFLYNLCIHIIRLKCLQSILNEKENFSYDALPDTVSRRGQQSKVEPHDDKMSPIKTKMHNIINEESVSPKNNTIKKEHSEIDETICEMMLNSNCSSSSISDNINNKLKRLEICFDKIMNKNEKYEKNSWRYNDNSKLYFIALREYSQYNTSFQYLKKRKNKEIHDEGNIRRMMKNNNISLNNDKNKRRDICINNNNYSNNYYEPKSSQKRSLIISEEKKKMKKVKMNSNSFNEVNIFKKGCYSMEKSRSENKNKYAPMKEVEKEEDGSVMGKRGKNNSNCIGVNNVKEKEKKEVSTQNYTDNMSHKRNMNENHQKKTLLPFDNMFYSNLRILLCLQYKEKYNVKDEEMLVIDKYFYIVEFINNIIRDGILNFSNEIKANDIIKKTKNYIRINNIDDLCEYSLLFNNIHLKFCIIEGICFYFYKSNFDILTQKNNMNFWTSLFYFGIYNNFFSLIKYAIDKIEYKDRKKKVKNLFEQRRKIMLNENEQHKHKYCSENIHQTLIEQRKVEEKLTDDSVEKDTNDESEVNDSEGRAESKHGYEQIEYCAEVKDYCCGDSVPCETYINDVESKESYRNSPNMHNSVVNEYDSNVNSYYEEDICYDKLYNKKERENQERAHFKYMQCQEEEEEEEEEEADEVDEVDEEVDEADEEADEEDEEDEEEEEEDEEDEEEKEEKEEEDEEDEEEEEDEEGEDEEGEDEEEEEDEEDEEGEDEHEENEDEENEEEEKEEEENEEEAEEEKVADEQEDESVEEDKEEMEKVYDRYHYKQEKIKLSPFSSKLQINNPYGWKKKKRYRDSYFKVEAQDLKNLSKVKAEFTTNNAITLEDIKNIKYKLFPNNCKDSYFKIPLISVLKYIVNPINGQSTFLSFFNFFEEDNSNIEELKSDKEKNSILLLSALLNIPQIDYIKIKNFFTIIDEFFYLEKTNFRNTSNGSNMKDVVFVPENMNEVKRVGANKKTWAPNDIFIRDSNYYNDHCRMDKEKLESNTTTFTYTTTTSATTATTASINNNYNMRTSRNDAFSEMSYKRDLLKSNCEYASNFEKEIKWVKYNEEKINNSDGKSNNIALLRDKNTFDSIGKKLVNHIKDMNKAISGNQFLINNNISSLCEYLNDISSADSSNNDMNEQNASAMHGSNSMNSTINANNVNPMNGGMTLLKGELGATSKKVTKENNICSISLFCEITNEIVHKLTKCKGTTSTSTSRATTINKYLPYILKICFLNLDFLKGEKLINMYIKYMYLYEYLYHMILNRILYISTVKSFPFLQNIILKELHFYFEDFKNRKVKNLWKFYLYVHTLIDINKNKNSLITKLFHNNAIEYFIKLFYSISFYNPAFSVLFLKLIETPLFYRNIENKREEILQNLWIGTHERSFANMSPNKKCRIEYKFWLDSYKKFSER
ncbi:conserved Plasmodium protein, unknown function [Plasmodium malariae]|uniref:Uncharacterized protein n=1 Tax=Plasmodium malariae TaxID=5858 RepID=A0A1D3SQB1_PLAMA|nr:conserved Plasmodium protein, unknown function [Plasmodium malariae]SCO94068.1 conserved Plasmodium protein, unknown function [Plasmodium malariae]